MKIPDVNILIYAHDASLPFHSKARNWLVEALPIRVDPVGIAPVAALAFIRLICNPKVFKNPLRIAEACKVVQSWTAAGAVWIDIDKIHFETAKRLLEESHGGLNLLTDVHLAALAIDHRATLFSNDRDFARFKGLKVKNPVD